MTRNDWSDAPRGFMDFWQSIKYRESDDSRFPIIFEYNRSPSMGVILLANRRKSTTQELREVACSECLGSAVIITEVADSSDSLNDQGTSEVFRNEGVAFILQNEGTNLFIIPCS